MTCPHCGNGIQIVEPVVGEVTCNGCGSSFKVDPHPTTTHQPSGLPGTIGKFTVLEQLGRGAFGTVYKARDPELQRLVAVKVPRAGSFATAEEEERFLREARAAAQLSHPGIVPVLEIAHDGGVPYIVSEYVEGLTLADVLTGRRPAFRESAELVAAVADALDYAHRRKIVHRDVKPSNLLIDHAGAPHVTDFGLARRGEGEITVTLDGQILGTPAYMAPEQAAGDQQRVDARSDVYSLGVVLYELLAGELPFRGNQRMLLHQVLNDEPRPPRSLNDRIPRDLETVTLKAMAKEPAHRYATAQELADDLSRFLRGEPIRARPIRAWESALRWAKRRPAAAALAGLSILTAAALVALIVGTAFYSRLHRTLKSEQAALAKASAYYYLNLIAQTQAAEDNRNALQVESLLRDCPADLRHWEWLYLKGNRTTFTLKGHTDSVLAVAFHPGGRILASASSDKTLKLWDLSKAAEQCSLTGHTDAVVGAVFSPDGQRLASASKDGTIRLWDAQSGDQVNVIRSHKKDLLCICFRPDGAMVACGSSDGTVLLWDISTGRESFVLGGHLGAVTSVAFSPDGTMLACGDPNEIRFPGPVRKHQVKVWDVNRRQEVASVDSFARSINCVCFSPDGQQLVAASSDETIRCLNPLTGHETQCFRLGAGEVFSVCFSPDGRRLVGSTADGAVHVYDSSTGQRCLTLKKYEGYVKQPTVGGEASFLRRHAGHSKAVYCLAFSPDGNRLASGGADHSIIIWNATPK